MVNERQATDADVPSHILRHENRMRTDTTILVLSLHPCGFTLLCIYSTKMTVAVQGNACQRMQLIQGSSLGSASGTISKPRKLDAQVLKTGMLRVERSLRNSSSPTITLEQVLEARLVVLVRLLQNPPDRR